MELKTFADVDAFMAIAGEFLEAREAEHNLILGISSYVRVQPNAFGEQPPYIAAVLAGGRVVAAAMRTPPHNLILSEIDEPSAIDLLVADRLGDDLPGVLGPVEHARAFAERWSAATGGSMRRHISERIFRLREVIAPPPVPGRLRIATPDDRGLVATWIRAFTAEALGEDDPDASVALTDRWLEGRGRTLYLWDDAGPVSLCGVGGVTPHGIRIGPVYTPPAARRQGYASALVAEASQLQLDTGRRFCFLFTDLSNPTRITSTSRSATSRSATWTSTGSTAADRGRWPIGARRPRVATKPPLGAAFGTQPNPCRSCHGVARDPIAP